MPMANGDSPLLCFEVLICRPAGAWNDFWGWFSTNISPLWGFGAGFKMVQAILGLGSNRRISGALQSQIQERRRCDIFVE